MILSREVGRAMRNSQWNEKKAYEFIESEPKLSLDKAEEILKNVYQAAGISPPDNCAEILQRGAEHHSEYKDA